MRKNLLPWSAAVGAAVSLAISSCTYDPYYASAGGYSGYGDGYGYGGSNFSTSFFVSTGDSRWGYDPYTYCYYDYRSRRYYDPYLYGYYPVGYRPYALYGVPHPYGWRPGSRYCPPPRTVRDVTVVNYRNRESAYRNTDYSWARQVRQQPQRVSPREPDYRSDRTPSNRAYSDPGSNRSRPNPYNRDTYNREIRGAPDTGSRSRGFSRPPAPYNTPVTRPEVPAASPDRFNRQDPRTQASPPPTINRPDFNRSSRRIEPSIPRTRPDFPRPEESRGHHGNFQRPQPASPPAASPPTTPNPPPAGNEQPSRGEGRGRLRSLGEG